MKKDQLRIGITGSAGSGKSLVGKRMAENGWAVLDCDEIARQVVAPGERGLKRLVAGFGPAIVMADGTLDRGRLRQMMLETPDVKHQLDRILHPLIEERMKVLMDIELTETSHRVAAVEVPLLFESGLDGNFDLNIAVVGQHDRLVSRISQRDQVSEHKAESLLALQMDQQEKSRRADYTIINNRGVAQLFELVDKLMDKIEKEYLTIFSNSLIKKR